MTTIELIMLFWVVPSLVTFLGISAVIRARYGNMETWELFEWGWAVWFSVFYPMGLLFIVLFSSCIESFLTFLKSLTKERSFKKLSGDA